MGQRRRRNMVLDRAERRHHLRLPRHSEARPRRGLPAPRLQQS